MSAPGFAQKFPWQHNFLMKSLSKPQYLATLVEFLCKASAPLISVVIPNYNYGPYLAEAIDSVLRQTYPNVEVIVVDDGSTDGSESVLCGYGERVRWFRQQNRGVSAARNRGIRESMGSLVAFLDADDVWLPEKLAEQVQLLKEPSVGMVYSGLQYINTAGQRIGTNLDGRSGQMLKEIALLRGPGVPAAGSSALVRRECFERVGLFNVDLSTSADWDMWRRIACHYEIEIVRKPLILYRLHDSSMHRNVALFERDMLCAFSSMFEDPAAKEIHPLRRRCYSNLYLTLSGSYLHAGQWNDFLKYAIRSIITWPPSLAYLASFPVRRVRKRFSRSNA